MPMLRYTGGGPTYVEDPRVAEAQRWAQLGQGRAALDAQREAGVRAAQAAVAQAEIEARSRESVARQQAAARELQAEQELARALLQEQGWTQRVGLQEQGLDRRRAASDRAAMERAQLQAGAGGGREDNAMLRFLLQEQGQDRRADERNLIDLLGLLPRQERDPDALERGDLTKGYLSQVQLGLEDEGLPAGPAAWRVILDQARAYQDPRIYNPVLEAVQKQIKPQESSPLYDAMGSSYNGWKVPEWVRAFFAPSAPEGQEFLAEEPMPEKVDLRTELLLKRLGL